MVGMFILISGAIMHVAVLIFSIIYGDINILVSALLAYRAGRKPRLFFIPYLLLNAVCSFFYFCSCRFRCVYLPRRCWAELLMILIAACLWICLCRLSLWMLLDCLRFLYHMPCHEEIIIHRPLLVDNCKYWLISKQNHQYWKKSKKNSWRIFSKK